MTYSKALTALADPTRRAILQSLHAGPQNVTTLAATLPVSRPAVSQHLKVLADAGLLKITPKGTNRVYSMAPDGIQDLQKYLELLWGGALNSFSQYIER